MLVLSRHINERIVIGDDIVITIVDIRGTQKVRVGIEAPDGVTVHRKEIYDLIQRERDKERLSRGDDEAEDPQDG